MSMLLELPALCRLWDVHITKCRQVLRGHVDSVNDIQWQPYGAAIATGLWSKPFRHSSKYKPQLDSSSA